MEPILKQEPNENVLHKITYKPLSANIGTLQSRKFLADWLLDFSVGFLQRKLQWIIASLLFADHEGDTTQGSSLAAPYVLRFFEGEGLFNNISFNISSSKVVVGR